MGMLGEPSTALIAGNLIFVNASMNTMAEDPGSFGMLIDSGSPVVLIDPSLFGTTPPTTAAQIDRRISASSTPTDSRWSSSTTRRRFRSRTR